MQTTEKMTFETVTLSEWHQTAERKAHILMMAKSTQLPNKVNNVFYSLDSISIQNNSSRKVNG